MKISGTFEVKDQDGNVISRGTNTITNIGKKLICDWLAHDNFSSNEQDLFSGKSLSHERFINYQEITPYVLDSEMIPDNCLKNYATKHLSGIYPSMVMGNIFEGGDSIYLEINNRSIDCSGLLLYGQSRGETIQCFEISTTNLRYAEIKDKSESYWVKQKYVAMPSASVASSFKYKNCKIVRFDNPFSVDQSIENVKTIRIKFLENENYDYFDMYGIGILEKNAYPMPPCVIGLGTSATEPTVNDSDLLGLSTKFFVNKHKSDYSDEENIKIIYSGVLNYNESNNIQFNEIGLYFHNGQVLYTDTPDVCKMLFSRGIFDTPWTKSHNSIVDVSYCINIYSYSSSSSSSGSSESSSSSI